MQRRHLRIRSNTLPFLLCLLYWCIFDCFLTSGLYTNGLSDWAELDRHRKWRCFQWRIYFEFRLKDFGVTTSWPWYIYVFKREVIIKLCYENLICNLLQGKSGLLKNHFYGPFFSVYRQNHNWKWKFWVQQNILNEREILGKKIESNFRQK